LRSALSVSSEPDARARIAAWLGAIVYAANPNLIYLQTTAMTESLYLALFCSMARADYGPLANSNGFR